MDDVLWLVAAYALGVVSGMSLLCLWALLSLRAGDEPCGAKPDDGWTGELRREASDYARRSYLRKEEIEKWV